MERACVAAQGRRLETKTTRIRYVAELVGADIDSETRYPVADCADGSVLRPGGNRAHRGFGAADLRLKTHLVRSTFNSCRAYGIEGSQPPFAIQELSDIAQRCGFVD